MSILSTFIGLLLALYFNNIEQQRNEANKTIQIIRAISNDLENEIFSSVRLIDVRNFDTTARARGIDLPQYIKRLPISRRELSQTYMNSEQIIRNVNPSLYSLITMYDKSASEYVTEINAACDSNYNNRKTRKRILQYFKQLDAEINVLNFAQDCLKKGWDDKDINTFFKNDKFWFGSFTSKRFEKVPY